MAKTFSAQVDEFVATYKKRLNAIVRSSAQDLVNEVQTPAGHGGNMRVDTGFLRASLQSSISEMPSISGTARPAPNSPKNSFSYNDSQVTLTINNAKIGVDTIYFGFTASYAPFREYKDGFVKLAAQNWAKIVTRNVEKSIRAFP